MKKAAIIASVLVGGIAAGSALRICRAQEAVSGAQLFWGGGDASLFIGLNRLGSCPPLAVDVLSLLRLAPFGVGAQDQKLSVVVLRITPDSSSRFVVENMAMEPFGVVNGSISSALWRWNGDHFEPTSLSDVRGLRRDFEFSDVDGWSKRSILPGETPAEGRRVAFSLAGKPVTLIIHRTPQESTVIDLQRTDRVSERLWSHDERPTTVRRSEYELRFKR